MAPPASMAGKKIRNNFTAKRIDSEALVYQTKNTARHIQKRGLEKTSFKPIQTIILNVSDGI